MEPFELALIELLDHLGRRAARRGIPAPRKDDRIGDWCRFGKEGEADLREYLARHYPRWPSHDDQLFYGASFAELLRLLAG